MSVATEPMNLPAHRALKPLNDSDHRALIYLARGAARGWWMDDRGFILRSPSLRVTETPLFAQTVQQHNARMPS